MRLNLNQNDTVSVTAIGGQMTDLNYASLREPVEEQEIKWFENIVGRNYWKNEVMSLIPSELILLNLTVHTMVIAGFRWRIL